jgi:acylphosphatase
MIACRLVVEGFVQGVGYREYILNKAIMAGVNGAVKNLSDGSVEITVEGDERIVNSFTSQLKSEINKELGRCAGKVTGIHEEEVQPIGFTEFRIKR